MIFAHHAADTGYRVDLVHVPPGASSALGNVGHVLPESRGILNPAKPTVSERPRQPPCSGSESTNKDWWMGSLDWPKLNERFFESVDFALIGHRVRWRRIPQLLYHLN